jgi:hypothetical protein
MIEVRPLTELAEFREAVRIQRIIWGFVDLELLRGCSSSPKKSAARSWERSMTAI